MQRRRLKAIVYLSRYTDDPGSLSSLAAKYVTKKVTGNLSYRFSFGDT